MRKLFLMVLLTIASNSARAEWVKVFTDNDNTVVFYAAPSSKQNTGVDTVKMWSMNDLKAAQSTDSKSYLSVVAEREYNCKSSQDRLLYSSYHSGNMGGREVANAVSEDKKWTPIKTNTPNDALLEIACHSVEVHTTHQ